MYLNILTEEQKQLLPLISQFKREYYLVGGTAIALQIGHRKSIDFDLFKIGNIKRTQIKKKIIEANFKIEKVLFEDNEQLHLIVNGIKLTFFQYPYDIPHKVTLEKIITMPTLLDLAAMKAYALGKRAKWKDYVDLYFLLKECHSYQEIAQRTQEIFTESFNDKLFREQLSYFEDINYTEEVEYCRDETSEDTIKKYLQNIAISIF